MRRKTHGSSRLSLGKYNTHTLNHTRNLPGSVPQTREVAYERKYVFILCTVKEYTLVGTYEPGYQVRASGEMPIHMGSSPYPLSAVWLAQAMEKGPRCLESAVVSEIAEMDTKATEETKLCK